MSIKFRVKKKQQRSVRFYPSAALSFLVIKLCSGLISAVFLYFKMFSQKRCRIAATCARVALPRGIRFPSLPFRILSPQIHCMAGNAYSEISSASL